MIQSLQRAKKGQVATTDLILSMILVLLFIGLMIAAFMWSTKRNSPQYIYGSVVFDNLEGNANTDFVSNYKIDGSKLTQFQGWATSSYDDMRLKVLNNTDFIPGVDDVCLFTRDDSATNPLAGPGTICSPANPCKNHALKYIFVKPVEYNKKIQNLLVVLCVQ